MTSQCPAFTYMSALSLKHFTELTRCIQIYKWSGWLHQHWIESNWMPMWMFNLWNCLPGCFGFFAAVAWVLVPGLMLLLLYGLMLEQVILLLFVTDCSGSFLHTVSPIEADWQQLCYLFLFLSEIQQQK